MNSAQNSPAKGIGSQPRSSAPSRMVILIANSKGGCGKTTIATLTPQGTEYGAILINPDRAIRVSNPATGKVAYSTAFRFLTVSNTVIVDIHVSRGASAKSRRD